MILKVNYFFQVPAHIRNKICQCGGQWVFKTKPESYDWVEYRCKECGKDKISYWYNCTNCNTYFHKNPKTFSHPGWLPTDPICWSCLEEIEEAEGPDYWHEVRKNNPFFTENKIPPTDIKKKLTTADINSFLEASGLGDPFHK